MKRVWLVASENGAFPGGKVGGVGDVIRDLPIALAATDLNVRVVTPSYGMFHKVPGSILYRRLSVRFRGRTYMAKIFKVPGGDPSVKHFVVEHPLLSPKGPGRIYVGDEPGKPFAIDAAKFAFFNAVVAVWVNGNHAPPDVLHLNDWHTGLIPALREFGLEDAPLRNVRIVYTIHNLAYQGIRPFEGDESSIEAWFPELLNHKKQLRDPRYHDCINFMATAIRLADEVNTVSPRYAQEIQRPSDPEKGFSGGEGLEAVLGQAQAEGRLSGILNGCMYPEKAARAPGWDELLQIISERKPIINASRAPDVWIKRRTGKRPRHLLLSIGRVAEQKVPLFLEPVTGYASALEAILAALGPESLFLMLGSGEQDLEERFVKIARTNNNFLYLRGYAEALSALLYASSDLFLMPSSFEPCGISQMLAMRAGQPCVVHAVGGLKDTVEDGVTGFVFEGDSVSEQAENFVHSVKTAIAIRQDNPARWLEICGNAARQRFSWEVAALKYRQRLYGLD
jgi:starch synthase